MSARRRRRTGGLSFDSWYAQNFGAIGWTLQEPSGDVALAINKRVDLGRNVIRNPNFTTDTIWVKGVGWTIPGGNVAHCDGTQVAESFLANPLIGGSIIPFNGTFRGTFTITNYVSGTVTIRPGSSDLTRGTPRSGNDTFVEDLTYSSSGTSWSLIASDDFEGDVSAVLAQQTDIASDKEFPGAEELNEAGAHGTATAANWTDINNGDLTNPSAGILRIARDGTNDPAARQIIITIGKRDKVIAEVRSDGNAIPRVLMSGGVAFTGTTSTDWQTVNFELVGAINDRFTLESQTSTGTEYTEWRILSVKPANPLNATNNGMAVAQPGAGNIPFVYSSDGGTMRLSFDTIAEINSIINMSNGGFVMVAQSDTWAAGVDELVHFGVDPNNYWRIYRSAATLNAEYVEDGNSSLATLDTTTLPGGSPTGLYTIGLKYDVDGFGLRGLYKGVQFDTDKAIAAAIIGNLDKDETALFAADSSGTSSWAGDGAYPALQTETPPDSFFAEFHNRSGL